VPERVVLKTRFSSVLIDLTQADIRTPVVTLHVDDVCSSTDIVVPDDFTADLNGLRCMGSSASSKVGSAPPAGRVHVIVRGNLRFGALTVKHPFGAWLRKTLLSDTHGASKLLWHVPRLAGCTAVRLRRPQGCSASRNVWMPTAASSCRPE
jgi:hypothetical protein